MNKAYTPKERAYRIGTFAWLGVGGAFSFLLITFVSDGTDFLGICLMASIVLAIFAVLLGVYSLFLASSPRAWWATILAALVLAAYGLVVYLMRDFCVIC